MTIRLPQKTWVDKILKIFGKERRVLVDDDIYQEYGPYVLVQGRFESFWKCLLRRRSKEKKSTEETLDRFDGNNE